MAYTSKQVGSKYSPSFKTYILKDGKVISPFHDIPLVTNGSFDCVHCINEIPRFEHGKFEICKEEPFNPICQDVKKGKVRFVKNVFPSFGYPFNYGAFPQTWENPTVEDPECRARGDNDPVDIVEIGSKVKKIGEVYQGKVLGALALLDDNEADWKIVVIDSKDGMAEKVSDIEDVRRHFPGLLEFIFKWFRDYKVPDGKPKNIFAFEGRFLDAKFAKDIIRKTHEDWKGLVAGGYEKVKIDNSTHKGSKGFNPDGVEIEDREQPDTKTPDELCEFSYVSE